MLLTIILTIIYYKILCVVAMPQLTQVVRLHDDRRVVGLTSVDSRRLFVLQCIQVNNTLKSTRRRHSNYNKH
jgi:hypothetical protein